MKELIGQASNQYIVEGKKGPIVMTELIWITSEPVYQADGGGGFARVRVPDQVRVSVQPQQLLEIAKWITEAAKSAKELADRTTIEPEETP